MSSTQYGQWLGLQSINSYILAIPNSAWTTLVLYDIVNDTTIADIHLTSALSNSSPSRTCFDTSGDVWVANRAWDMVTKVAITSNQRTDISPSDYTYTVYPPVYGTDPYVLSSTICNRNYGSCTTYIPKYAGGPIPNPGVGNEGLRGIACDSNGYMWVASYTNPTYIWKFHKDNTNGEAGDTIVTNGNYSIYGAGYNIYSNKIVFTPQPGGQFLLVDPETNAITYKNSHSGFYGFGMGSDGSMYRPNISGRYVAKFDQDGNYVQSGALPSAGYSCCVFNGNLYVCDAYNPYISVFDCDNITTRLQAFNTGGVNIHGIGGNGAFTDTLWAMGYNYNANPTYAYATLVNKVSLDSNGLVTSISNTQTLPRVRSFPLKITYNNQQSGNIIIACNCIPHPQVNDSIYISGASNELIPWDIDVNPYKVSVHRAIVGATSYVNYPNTQVANIKSQFTASNYNYGLTIGKTSSLNCVFGPVYLVYVNSTPNDTFTGYRYVGDTLHYCYSDFTGYYSSYID